MSKKLEGFLHPIYVMTQTYTKLFFRSCQTLFSKNGTPVELECLFSRVDKPIISLFSAANVLGPYR